MSSKALLCTWCSSAKREGFNHITQKTTSITVSLTRITAHSIITNFVRVTHLYIAECYEILNSRFALEHRYSKEILLTGLLKQDLQLGEKSPHRIKV